MGSRSSVQINVEQLYLAEMVIPNLDIILLEAEKVTWLTSINRVEAQYGVGKTNWGPTIPLKPIFRSKPMLKLISPKH